MEFWGTLGLAAERSQLRLPVGSNGAKEVHVERPGGW